MDKKITIKEIADLAGVSPTAVSFVINNRKGISDEVRNHIKDIIDREGFVPNAHTRKLNLGKSFNVQVVLKQNLSPFCNMFYLEILQGILNESVNFDYSIVLSDITCLKNESRLFNSISSKDVDGIIFISDASQGLFSKVNSLDIPFIIVDTQHKDCNYNNIRIDYYNAAKTSVEYLISKGHNSIAFIGMETNPLFYLNTFSGYKKALENNDLTVNPTWIQASAYDEESSYVCMENILKSNKIPTAVFCASDVFALTAMKCAKDKGYSLPYDISFFGMDDVRLSRYITPALSTLSIDTDFMGRIAMKSIINIINKKPFTNIVLPSNNINERESVTSTHRTVKIKKF